MSSTSFSSRLKRDGNINRIKDLVKYNCSVGEIRDCFARADIHLLVGHHDIPLLANLEALEPRPCRRRARKTIYRTARAIWDRSPPRNESGSGLRARGRQSRIKNKNADLYGLAFFSKFASRPGGIIESACRLEERQRNYVSEAMIYIARGSMPLNRMPSR